MLGYYSSPYYYVTSEHPSQMYTIISLVVICCRLCIEERKKKKRILPVLNFCFQDVVLSTYLKYKNKSSQHKFVNSLIFRCYITSGYLI